jgi:hypothetical protein
MSMGQSFSEILESKMRTARPATQSKSQHSDIVSEPWTQLIGHFSPLKTCQITVAERLSTKAYQAFKPKPKPRPNHNFNGEQAIAFGFFNNQGAGLEANFSRKDLSKAFRNLALKLHPDQGGSPLAFRQLMTARACLQGLVQHSILNK